MKVGSVTEIKKQEYRVGLTPDNVRSYCLQGHEVFIEKDAGLGSGFKNEEYQAAGAKIVDKAADIWANCEMIVKVKEPLEEEYPYFRDGQIIYTFFHLAAEKALTEALLKSKASAVAYETLQIGNGLPLLRPMSEIAGRLSTQEGASFLKKTNGGRGVLLSGVPGTPRARVLILGAGVVGSNAAKIAMGMGAHVTIMDVNQDRLVYLDDVYGLNIHTIYSSDANIEREIAEADLVISSVLIPGASAPKLVKKDYLKKMKEGSVIVDVSIDQGGTTEVSKRTYHDDPVFVVDGVIMYCVANMPGATPRTSTIALTNATLRYGLAIAKLGLEESYKKHPEIVSAINTYKGNITYKAVAEAFNMDYVPIK
ncbi:MAG: alanine dehydrogenase [Treponema sp.]|nr:alanine dehydrogenase [Treponema sp.]